MTRAESLTIVAIVVGPILALGAQRVLDRIREKKKRRMDIFLTLMTTRASPLAPNHIQALNSIDVIFLPKHFTDLEQDQLLARQRLLKVVTDDGIKVVVMQESPPKKD
jgi:hypothetical protein